MSNAQVVGGFLAPPHPGGRAGTRRISTFWGCVTRAFCDALWGQTLWFPQWEEMVE
jgi:hypothetical protein